MDYFTLLNQPRRPWLEEQPLKANFLALSAQCHPDRVHGGSPEQRARANQQYAELNAAYHCLREPKERLRHLLELERGAPPGDVQQIDADLIHWFTQASQVLRAADAFLQAPATTASPLLKAQRFQQGLQLSAQLQALAEQVNGRRQPLLAELKAMNARWESAPAPGCAGRALALPLARLEEVYRQLSYFARWTSQIQERALQISLQ